MMKGAPVKFAVVGIGNMGFSHVNNIRRTKDCILTAVCDINPAQFCKLSDGIRKEIKCYIRSEECFRDENVDAVLIATPHYFHVPLSIEAMRAGKHVLVEKPIAVHKKDAECLLREAAEHPKLVKTIMFNQRTLHVHKKLKQLIDSGELGTLRRINWIVTDWFRPQHYYDSGDWRASWRGEGGGVLLNQCPHQLDLMQWFFGMPSKVRAAVKLGKYHNIEVEDEVNAYLEYADGKTANFISSTGEAPGINRLEISSEKGLLTLEKGQLFFRRNEVETSEYSRTSKTFFTAPDCWECKIPVKTGGIIGHEAIIDNMVQTILGKSELIAPLEEGIRGLELGNAMLYSGLNETTVDLPLNSQAYSSMLDRLIGQSRWVPKKANDCSVSADEFNQSF